MQVAGSDYHLIDVDVCKPSTGQTAHDRVVDYSRRHPSGQPERVFYKTLQHATGFRCAKDRRTLLQVTLCATGLVITSRVPPKLGDAKAGIVPGRLNVSPFASQLDAGGCAY